MGMAGWKSDQMMAGLPGIMNLAAASGADLATTSDIVTDALTAFGREAGEAGKLADIMATASTNANTDVELMGETFKYAAPVAGALGYNMKDVAEATGLMASASIKGSQAGTSLRSIITRLSTDAGASSNKLGALGVLTEKLGVQFYNTDGTARNLNDVLNDARAVWGNLSDEEQINYANTIAGKNAMSGWLALMNAGEADVNKLHSALENCDGSAANIANTMQNNLQGKLTLFNSAVEGLGVQIYNYFSGPLQSVVGIATNVINGITDAITPQKTVLESFISDIKLSNDQVNQSIAHAQETVTNAETKVAELSAYGEEFGTILGQCEAFNLITLDTGEQAIVDSSGKIVQKIGEVGTKATSTEDIIKKFASDGMNTDGIKTSSDKAQELIGYVETKAVNTSEAIADIGSEESANALANANEQMGGLGEATQTVYHITDEFTKSKITAMVDALGGSVDGLADAWNAETGELTASKEQLEAWFSTAKEVAMYNALQSAIKELYDAWGTAAVNSAKANSALNEAIKEYNAEMGTSFKTMEEVNEAMETGEFVGNKYGQAVIDASIAVDNCNDSLDTAETELKKTSTALDGMSAAFDKSSESADGTGVSVDDATTAIQQLQAAEEGAEEATEDLTEANLEAIKSFKDLPGSVFDTYEKLADLQTQLGMSDTEFADWCTDRVAEAKEIIDAYDRMTGSIKTSLQGFVTELSATDEEGNESLEALIANMQQKSVDLQKWANNMKLIGQYAGTALPQGFYDQLLEQGPGKMDTAVEELANALRDGTGTEYAQSVIGRISEAWTDDLTIDATTEDLAKNSATGKAYEEALKNGFVGSIEDYKKAVEEGIEQAADAGTTTAEQVGGEAGEALAESTAEGVENKESEISDATSGSITDAKDVTLETARLFKNVGEMIPTMMGIGIHSNEESAKQKLTDLLDAMKKDAEDRKTDYSIIGRGYDTSLKDGIQDTVAHDAVVQAMKDLASDVGDEAYNSKDWMKRCGEWAAQAFADGISSKQSEAAQAGGDIANAGQDATLSWQNAYYNTGYYLAAGLADGIYSGKSRAINAAVAVAQGALNSARSVLGIHSPSKEFAEIGEMSMEGLAKGLQEGTADVNDQMRKNMSLAMDAAKSGLSEKGVEVSASMANHINMDSVQTISQMGNIQASVAEIGGIINALREDVRSFQEAFTAQGSRKAKVVLQVGSRQFDAYIVDTASAGMAATSKALMKGVGL